MSNPESKLSTTSVKLSKLKTTIKEAAVNVDKELVERGNAGQEAFAIKNDLDVFLESYSKAQSEQEEGKEGEG